MSRMPNVALTEHILRDGSLFYVGKLPDQLSWDSETFAEVWRRHPLDKHLIMIHGREVETPRYQQAFGAAYSYTGRTNQALPVPEAFVPLLIWAREIID